MFAAVPSLDFMTSLVGVVALLRQIVVLFLGLISTHLRVDFHANMLVGQSSQAEIILNQECPNFLRQAALT